MYLSLKDLVLKLLELIVKPNVLENCSAGCKLKTVDLKGDENLLPLDKVFLDAGFAVLDAVERAKKKRCQYHSNQELYERYPKIYYCNI